MFILKYVLKGIAAMLICPFTALTLIWTPISFFTGLLAWSLGLCSPPCSEDEAQHKRTFLKGLASIPFYVVIGLFGFPMMLCLKALWP